MKEVVLSWNKHNGEKQKWIKEKEFISWAVWEGKVKDVTDEMEKVTNASIHTKVLILKTKQKYFREVTVTHTQKTNEIDIKKPKQEFLKRIVNKNVITFINHTQASDILL